MLDTSFFQKFRCSPYSPKRVVESCEILNEIILVMERKVSEIYKLGNKYDPNYYVLYLGIRQIKAFSDIEIKSDDRLKSINGDLYFKGSRVYQTCEINHIHYVENNVSEY